MNQANEELEARVGQRTASLTRLNELLHAEVAERKQAEDALRQSEERFRLFMDHTSTLVWVKNQQGRYVYLNRAYEQRFGVTLEQILGKTDPELWPPETAARLQANDQIALAADHPVEITEETTGPDGRPSFWLNTKFAFHDTAGNLFLASIGVDITDRKRFQEAVQESEARLRLAVETADLGMYERDLATNQITLNDTCRKILGIGEGPPPPDVARRSAHPDDKDRVLALVARAFDPALREICAAEFRILRPDGTICWVSGRGRVTFDDTVSPPRPCKFMGVLHDITARKQAEQAVQRRTLHLQLLHQAAARLLLGQQPVDLLRQLHQQITQTFGADVFMLYQPDPANGHLRLSACGGVTPEQQDKLELLRYGRAICARPADALQPIVATHIQTREAPNRRFVRRLGLRSYLYYPLLLNNRLQGTLAFASHQRDDYDRMDQEFFHAIAGTLAEALERRRLESELQRHAAHLEQLVNQRTARLRETIAELEGFSYSLVHDLRAPLRAMQAFASVLQEESGPHLDPQGLDYLRKIKVAAHRMDQLITDSLNYSKLLHQELPLGVVNLGNLLRDLVDTYPNLQSARAGIRLEVGDMQVLGNESALTQVFSNLLGNAVKFVAQGVSPSVRVWAETRTPGRVLIWVEDNGIGIPEQAQEKIFGMFQRMHRIDEYPGTGIGLAIVRKSLERIGGQICLESEPGKGSRFCVELPLAPPGPAPLNQTHAA